MNARADVIVLGACRVHEYAGGLYGLALFGLISAFISAFFLHIPNPAASVPALGALEAAE
jgi:hypothetical protein